LKTGGGLMSSFTATENKQLRGNFTVFSCFFAIFLGSLICYTHGGFDFRNLRLVNRRNLIGEK
jgi:hypothetical protein